MARGGGGCTKLKKRADTNEGFTFPLGERGTEIDRKKVAEGEYRDTWTAQSTKVLQKKIPPDRKDSHT